MDNVDFLNVRNAIEAFKRGEFVMVMDRLDRENECDLVLAGEYCTPEKMAFMIHWSTGIVCIVSNQETLEAAGLYPAAPRGNTDKNQTNFYVSTDFLPTTTTGVSASDRCETVKAFCDLSLLKPENFSKPGHMFPLCSRPNGLRERDGHTESAYDLCRLANMKPVSIIGEMMHQDGTMMRLSDSIEFAKTHNNIPLITVPELKAYAALMLPEVSTAMSRKMSLVSTCNIKIEDIANDECTLSVYRNPHDPNIEIVALIRGDLSSAGDNINSTVPVRIHSECFTGDIIGSMRCDCGHQLHAFMKQVMNNNTPSILIYVRGHEGRGIGLANKIKCYQIQDEEKLDTVDANLRLGFNIDGRTFDDCWAVLRDLIGSNHTVDLYTNNPQKAAAAIDYSVRINRLVPLASVPNGVNNNYLMTKQLRLKHKTCIDTMRWDELLGVVGDSNNGNQSPEHAAVKPRRVCVISAKWNDEYVIGMVNACLKELSSCSRKMEIVHKQVPGAFDLISIAKKTAAAGSFDCIICIGVLIKGETDVYIHSCSAIANALAHLNTLPNVPPIINGVQMFNSEEQANDRLNDDSSFKLGISWAKSALSIMDL